MNERKEDMVLIAGAGLGGLALGLTCHQLGVPFQIFEKVESIKPLGVGINIQPHAVRELMELGLGPTLASIGVETREYGMFSKHGLEIWTEPRGVLAGYHWPQYSIHRGQLQMLLYETLVERAGADCIKTGWAAQSYDDTSAGVVLNLRNAGDGEAMSVTGSVLVGADGIHSALRKQLHPEEGEPK